MVLDIAYNWFQYGPAFHRRVAKKLTGGHVVSRAAAFVCVLCLLCICLTAVAQDKPRVFVTDSQSWEMSASTGGSGGVFAGSAHGGARPQKAEIIKTFGERCPQVTVNNIQEKADYVVLLDHEGGKGWIRKDNKVAVFNRAGDSIISKSTRSLGSSVEEACNAITTDWPTMKTTGKPPVTAESGTAEVEFVSVPEGADIEINGKFVGNTPSKLMLKVGEHAVTMKKSGYRIFEKRVALTGGSVKITGELEKEKQKEEPGQ